MFRKANLTENFVVKNHDITYIKLEWLPDGKLKWLSGGAVPEFNWNIKEVSPSVAIQQMTGTHLSY
jgi:hypothetical protein